jgi:hypothetical protein
MVLEYHGMYTYSIRVRTRVRTMVHVYHLVPWYSSTYTCTVVVFDIMLYLYTCTYSSTAGGMYRNTYCTREVADTIGTTSGIRVFNTYTCTYTVYVRTSCFCIFVHVYHWYVPWYQLVRTRVPWYMCTYKYKHYLKKYTCTTGTPVQWYHGTYWTVLEYSSTY